MFKRILVITTLLLAVCNVCFGADVALYPKFRATDSNGNPLVKGKLYTYIPGTTTAKATYTDKDAGTANANPVILNNKGEADVYLIGPTKLVLKDKNDVTIWSQDNVQGNNLDSGGNYKYPDSSATDHGATDASLNSVKDIIDGLAANEEATIFFRHDSGGVTTAYTFTTTETIPSNVALVFENGAIISGVTPTINGIIDAEPGQYIFDCPVIGSPKIDAVYSDWFGPAKDGVTDDSTEIKRASDLGALTKVKTKVSPGSYYIANPGVKFSHDNIFIEGTENTFFLCEDTYGPVDEGGGVYTVGQGNVFNGSGVSGVVLKDITIIGSYDQSWGDQDPYANQVPAGKGSNLLYLLGCENITLDNFKIKESYSNFVTLTTTHQAAMSEVYGWNQIKISGCTGVDLIDCSWTDSVGEAWLLYNCEKVMVDNCVYDVNYCVSQLDIIYSTYVDITNSSFLRRLESDAGDLLNVSCSQVDISRNNFLNGNCDIGNEYLNRNLTLGETFILDNNDVSNNTFDNGYVTMATALATTITPPTWPQENVNISDNTILIDLDTRPAAKGTTVLDYTAVKLPVNYNARGVSIHDNTIQLKGSLQAGGSTYNRLRLINGVQGASGYKREDISIQGNNITCDITSYDPGDLNDISGAIVFEYGEWTNLSIKNNNIDCPGGVLISRPDLIDKAELSENEVYGENFLNLPNKSQAFLINDMDINDNKFSFYNTSGVTYTSAYLVTRGYGLFTSIYGYSGTSIQRMNINNNTVYAPSLASISFNSTPTSYYSEIDLIGNDVTFTDYGILDVGATRYQLRIGKANTNNVRSEFSLVNNYFENIGSSDAIFILAEWDKTDIIANEFIGDFDITLDTDNLAAVSDSRWIFTNNLSFDGTITQSFTNGNAVVTRLNHENSGAFGITNTTSGTTIVSY